LKLILLDLLQLDITVKKSLKPQRIYYTHRVGVHILAAKPMAL